jgi:hypothetical protein
MLILGIGCAGTLENHFLNPDMASRCSSYESLPVADRAESSFDAFYLVVGTLVWEEGRCAHVGKERPD